MDAGRKFTDKQVAALERQLKKEYQQAYKELTQKSKKMLERYRKNRLDMLNRLEQGEISKDDFDAWVDRTMYRNLQMEKLIEEMSARMVHADQIAAELINGRLPATYAENFNYCSYLISIQAELNLSFTIINEHAVKRLLMDDSNLFPQARVDIPKDKLWNQKKIRSALTQGMLQGESIPKIAKRLQRVTDMDRTAAVRNARTLMTGANSAGRLDSMYEAKALGLAVKKVWVAQLDNRTRDTHVDLDGEERELDQEFSNGMDRPGGSGPPEEVYNCFIGSTSFCADSDILNAYKHWYDGDVVSIETTRGIKFTCTPNHPILTDRGWIHANELNKGENLLVTRVSDKILSGRYPYVNHIFARFDAGFELFKKMGGERRSALSMDFHGDFAATNVEVITQKGFLWSNGNTILSKVINKFLLKFANFAFMSKSALMKFIGRIMLSASRVMCGFGKSLPFIGRSFGHSQEHSFRAIALDDSIFMKSFYDGSPVNAEMFRKSIDGVSRIVEADKIVNINVFPFHGYVYNLQTDNNYYFVNDIISHNGIVAIAHNCRCDLRTQYDKYKTDMTDLRLRNITKMEQKSYEEWKSTRGTEGRKAERELRKAARERERAERQNKRQKSK